MKDLVLEYKKKKSKIKQRLREFESLKSAKDEDVFSELCFCILTPQSKAIYCDEAVKTLRKSGLLLKGSKRAIRPKLQRVRFPNNKTDYLISARKFPDIKNRLNSDSIPETRDWLVKNIKGLGYKEASHFLRNIGLGRDIAILDVHILRNLKKYKIIKEIPPSISRKAYLDIENSMRGFSKKVKIPLQELDLLFWSNQTGFVFK